MRPRGHPAWCVACCLLSATLILRSLKGSYLLVCPPTKLKVPGASEDVSDGCYWYLVDRGQRVCAQSCPTLCNPMDCSRPGSSVHGILQARILEWLPFPSPGNLPDPGIKSRSPALQVDSLPVSHLANSFLFPLHISGHQKNFHADKSNTSKHSALCIFSADS